MDLDDIIYQILLKCNIITIEKMIYTGHESTHRICSTLHFWHDKFIYDDLPTVQQPFNYPIHNILLYKTQKIITFDIPIVTNCKYIFKRGMHKNQRCNKITNGNEYYSLCIKKVGLNEMISIEIVKNKYYKHYLNYFLKLNMISFSMTHYDNIIVDDIKMNIDHCFLYNNKNMLNAFKMNQDQKIKLLLLIL